MFYCRNIKKNLSAFLDDELSEKRRIQIIAHLRNCPDCENNLEMMRKNNLSLGQYFRMGKNYIPEPREEEINSFMQNMENNVSTTFETETRGPGISFKNLIRLSKQKFYMDENHTNFDVSSGGAFVIQRYFHIIPALLVAAGIILLFATELHGF